MVMRKRFVTVAIILLIIIGAVFGGKAIYGEIRYSAPRKVAATFVTNIIAGNAQASYDLFTSDTQGQNPLNGSWGSYVARMHVAFDGQRPKLTSTTTSNGTVNVDYSIKGNDETTYDLTVTLVNESGWHVRYFVSRVVVQ